MQTQGQTILSVGSQMPRFFSNFCSISSLVMLFLVWCVYSGIVAVLTSPYVTSIGGTGIAVASQFESVKNITNAYSTMLSSPAALPNTPAVRSLALKQAILLNCLLVNNETRSCDTFSSAVFGDLKAANYHLSLWKTQEVDSKYLDPISAKP